MENFGGDLELKRLDLTWSGQVDLTAAILRTKLKVKKNLKTKTEKLHCNIVQKIKLDYRNTENDNEFKN